jgi:glycosyltransferase involved in cell wall biosynthesis
MKVGIPMKILVIIPAYNEAESIEKVLDSIAENAPFADCLVINDCSTDSTGHILKVRCAEYLTLPINLGIGGGIQGGYLYAREHDYDIAVQFDGDGQHDASYLQQLVQPILDGKADIVIGSRFIKRNGFQSSAMRRLGIRFLSDLIKLCTNQRIYDVTSGFRAVNRAFIDLYAKEYAQDYPEPEAIVSAIMNGAVIEETPIVMHERTGGTSSITLASSVYYMIKVSLAIILRRLSTRNRS